MPVLFAGREPDHVTGPDLLDRPAFALSPAAASHDDESLAERMRMPCSSRSRFEGYAGALDERGIRRLKQRINSYHAREPLRRSLRGSLRARAFDFHSPTPSFESRANTVMTLSCRCTLHFAPASRWNSFPSAESANEGISVLISEKVSRFIQLENGVVEIVASKLVASFFQNALEAGTFVLQAPLQSTGTDM